MTISLQARAPLGGDADHVVLVDGWGRPAGTVPKAGAHHDRTALHLAFSCHVVRPDGAVLLTRRALGKKTWPGWWTNACCGHPQLGETLRGAVTRRLGDELGVSPRRIGLALPDFAYRAVMGDGTVEHELCPVLLAEFDERLDLDPAEVDDAEWVAWADLVIRAERAPHTLTPWCVEQVRRLDRHGVHPGEWLDRLPVGGQLGLDTPVEPGPVHPALRLAPAGADDPIAVVSTPLEALLDAYLAGKASDAAATTPALRPVTAEIRSLLAAGGKRIRPAFVYWGHQATGAGPDPAVLRAAAAVELLHTFALLHDDVMDRAPMRRGRLSAYAALAERHRRSGGAGSSHWFGVSAAILAGDLTSVWADDLLDSCGADPDALVRARRVFTTLQEEVIAGQYLDLTVAADPEADEDAALGAALLKSARYTATRPLLLGAALGVPAPHTEEILSTYGDAIGLAFQMRDDVLGVFGDPLLTGKSCLDDLREGKRTVLVLRALRLADATGRAELAARLGDAALDDEGLDRCREIIAASGALASVERLIAHRHELAQAAAGCLPEPARSALSALAGAAVERRA